MTWIVSDLQLAELPELNRLVVGEESLTIESFRPVGDLWVDTPSGSRRIEHAATARCRCRDGRALVLFGECGGHLVGVRVPRAGGRRLPPPAVARASSEDPSAALRDASGRVAVPVSGP